MIRSLLLGFLMLSSLLPVARAERVLNEVSQDVALPPIGISRIITGRSHGALEATVVEGGRLYTVRRLIHQSIVIEHPKGRFLFDTGIGHRTEAGFSNNTWMNRQLFAYRFEQSVADALGAAGLSKNDLAGIWVSHLHWDHSGGLPELAGVPVWVTDEGLADARAGERPAYLTEHLSGEIAWQSLAFEEKPYRGFPRSRDWFGDGSLVLVDLSGHTRGHTGLFVNMPDHRRFFFIGDTTWTMQGVEQGASRPAFTQWLTGVDRDRAQNAAQIARITALRERDPTVVVIPAHDELAAGMIPIWPTRLTGQAPVQTAMDN